jgi:Ca2+-binding RTX toxin-like protein
LLNADAGNDLIYCGVGNDQAYGGADSDRIRGDAGNDSLYGDAGADSLSGADGRDWLFGDAGNDTLSGGEGADTIRGGTGADYITLWESSQSRDMVIFKSGDSGKSATTIDHVEGFESGIDNIDLRSFDKMIFEDLDYRGGGKASCYFDGQALRIDGDGDAITDMIIDFAYVDDLVKSDFLFA